LLPRAFGGPINGGQCDSNNDNINWKALGYTTAPSSLVTDAFDYFASQIGAVGIGQFVLCGFPFEIAPICPEEAALEALSPITQNNGLTASGAPLTGMNGYQTASALGTDLPAAINWALAQTNPPSRIWSFTKTISWTPLRPRQFIKPISR
jgi:hypothetical protein